MNKENKNNLLHALLAIDPNNLCGKYDDKYFLCKWNHLKSLLDTQRT